VGVAVDFVHSELERVRRMGMKVMVLIENNSLLKRGYPGFQVELERCRIIDEGEEEDMHLHVDIGGPVYQHQRKRIRIAVDVDFE
jgi:hypothetical protein